MACKTSKDPNPSVVMLLQRDSAVAFNCFVCSLFREKFCKNVFIYIFMCVCACIVSSKYRFHNSRLWGKLVESKHMFLDQNSFGSEFPTLIPFTL